MTQLNEAPQVVRTRTMEDIGVKFFSAHVGKFYGALLTVSAVVVAVRNLSS